jgi:hypothetical protein
LLPFFFLASSDQSEKLFHRPCRSFDYIRHFALNNEAIRILDNSFGILLSGSFFISLVTDNAIYRLFPADPVLYFPFLFLQPN